MSRKGQPPERFFDPEDPGTYPHRLTEANGGSDYSPAEVEPPAVQAGEVTPAGCRFVVMDCYVPGFVSADAYSPGFVQVDVRAD